MRRSLNTRSSSNKRSLDDIVAGFTHVRRYTKAAGVQQRGQIRQHGRAAAYHDAIIRRIERRHSDIRKKFTRFYERGDAPLDSEIAPV
jgi:hypothetical protein